MNIPVRWELDSEVCDAYEVVGRGSSELHGHHHFLLTFITRGRGVQALNGEDVPFSENYVFLLSPADFHKNTVGEGESFDYFGVKFRYSLFDSIVSHLGSVTFPAYARVSNKCAQRLRQLFPILVEECSATVPKKGRDMLVRALLTEIFILVFRELPASEPNGRGEVANRALAFIYSNFNSPITVSAAARHLGYSENYFNTVFREQLGKPFSRYLCDLRLEYAKNLLVTSDMSETEIALELGFSSLSHFSRIFTKKFGICAKDYRAENKLKK